MFRHLASIPLFASLVLAMGVTKCSAPPGSCTLDGVVYEDGARNAPAPDGCNTCSCEDGAISCTERACIPSCIVDGVSYPDGASDVPAPDGCNTCTCDGGVVTQCSEIACSTCSVFGTAYTGQVPASDLCNTCSCEDGRVGASCTDRACGPVAIEPCTAWSEFPSDSYQLGSVAVSGDVLRVGVGYGGGCEPHYFRLCYDQFLESFPVQVMLRLEHDGQDDPCDAVLSESREFDLTTLANAYREGYATEHGTLILRLGAGARYSF